MSYMKCACKTVCMDLGHEDPGHVVSMEQTGHKREVTPQTSCFYP